MPAAVLNPQARQGVLKDTTKSRQNLLQPASAGTKRRHDGSPVSSQNAVPKRLNGSSQLGSSQPKSHFEEEVLEKLTQDINGLKQKNSEKDQQWHRPSLDDFNESTDGLCFQQIDAEEGVLHGGRTTVKLFGTTEV